MLTAIENVANEFSQALRRLGREWAFTAAFVGTLALGIAANMAVFSALDAYLFHPLPYPHSGQLFNVYLGSPKYPVPKGESMSAALYQRLHKTPAIAASGLESGYGMLTVVVPGTRPQNLSSAGATASVFRTLGVPPLIGRWIDPAADRSDGPAEVVLSYQLWQSAFGGDPHALGRTLRVSGKQYTIVGVMPRGFSFPTRSTQLWLPAVLTPTDLSMQRATDFNWSMIARLKPGISTTLLRTQLGNAFKRFEQEMPLKNRKLLQHVGAYAGFMPWRQLIGGATSTRLLFTQLGALALLLLAVASLANLALVRALRRRDEFALRVILGAGRLRLLLTTLCEALLLAGAATLLAWPLARLGTQAFVHFGIASQDTAFNLSSGAGIWLIAFALALALAIGVLALPQAFLRTHRPASLFQGTQSAGSGRGTRRLRMGLSVAQIALAVLLLAGASLLGLSLRNMLSTHPGFNANRLYVASVDLQGARYRNWNGWHSAQQRLHEAVAHIPGVTASAAGNAVPFSGGGSSSAFRPAHTSAARGLPRIGAITLAGPGLMHTLGVHLLKGRLIESKDIATDAHVVVVDKRFAEAALGSTDVVGKTLACSLQECRIVGVVETIRDQFAAHYSAANGTVFVPASPSTFHLWGGATDILVRSTQPPALLAREIRTAVHQALPDQSLLNFQPMQQLIAHSAQGASALASLLIVFGLLAFVLASVGTYGVVAYLTGLRRREFAIRQALGAQPFQIEWLVLGQGLALWLCGALLGVGFAFVFARFLQSELYKVSVLTPAAYLVPACVLGLVVAFASWLPARRARRLDLLSLLRPQ